MHREIKADLSLLNELVVELDKQLNNAYEVRGSAQDAPTTDSYRKFVIELSKAVGVLSSISQESVLLVGDLQKMIQIAGQSKEMEDPNSILKSILAPFGKSGSRN